MSDARATHALPTAEFVMGLIYSIDKRLAIYRDAQNASDWHGPRALGYLRQVAGQRVWASGSARSEPRSRVSRSPTACS